MLTMKAMTGGGTYAEHHLSNNDYYSVGDRVKGEWRGRGAELLGLQGEVTMDQFDAVRKGNDPSTDKFLRPRQSGDRLVEKEVNGQKITEVYKARNLFDFILSAPKAVSILALADTRLLEAHNIAVGETAKEMEGLAGCYVRKDGARNTRITSNMVIARYNHDTSRELDPQIHSHLVAANLSYDGAEGRWKTLAAYDIYQRVEYLTEVYRNALAREIARLGYRIVDRFEHGKDLGFGIAGIEESTLEKYSQRSAHRDHAIREFVNENGRQPSNNEIARLVRDTRDAKLTEISAAEVKARQLAHLDPEEDRTLRDRPQAALERGSIREHAPAGPSLCYAAEHIFERVSVAKEHELQAEALRHGRGRIDLDELRGALLGEVATGNMLAARGEIATEESLDRERAMVRTIDEGIKKFESLGRGREFVPSGLRSEQKQAIQAVLESRSLAFDLKGAAGVGKTRLLQELQRALTEARRGVAAVAPTAGAVEELQHVGFPNAVTIARLLNDPQQQHELAGQVLIVDEAGMVSSKDMAELIGLAKTAGARIVFSGDTAQIKSVSEGDALRVLERASNLERFSLFEVVRQSDAAYKEAVEALRNHPAEGFSKLEAMGAVREVDWRLKAQEVSKSYREAAAIPNVKGRRRSVLVVAATHDEIKSITHAIRQDRKGAGELASGETLTQHSALNWTEAQKKQAKKYRPGMLLEFHKAVKGVDKNETLEVVSAGKTGIVARRASGETVTLTAKQAKAFGVFERQDI